jgi:hypothetical protein
VATVLHLRLTLPEDTLARLFRTSRTTIRRALTETRHLLDQHGRAIEPVTTPPALPGHIPPYVPRAADSPEESEIKKRVNYLQALSELEGRGAAWTDRTY